MEKWEVDNVMTNLRSYLEGHNINTSRMFRCLNPNHIDTNASMKYYDDNRVYCFGCGANYNLVDVIGIMENLEPKEAFKKALQYYAGQMINPNMQPIKEKPKTEKIYEDKDYGKAYKVWQYNFQRNQEAKDYIKSRGISLETAKKFKIGYNCFDFNEFNFKSVVIPTNNHCFSARNISMNDGKMKYYKPKGCFVEIFNLQALFNNQKYCVITEGEFDCLSFDTIGINAIGLSGANNTTKLFEKDIPKDKTYILALDNDNAGYNSTNEIIDYFNDNNINFCTFDNCGYNDANQALVCNKEKFKSEIYNIVNSLTCGELSKNRKKKLIAEM